MINEIIIVTLGSQGLRYSTFINAEVKDLDLNISIILRFVITYSRCNCNLRSIKLSAGRYYITIPYKLYGYLIQ